MTASPHRFRGALVALLAVLAVALAPGAGAATLKIATLSPEGSSWMQLMRAGAEEIAERTDGRVRFRFYPGGVMGDDAAVLRKIRFGQLQGAAVTVGALTPFYPDVQVYNLPMVFRDYDEVDAVREEIDPVIEAGLAEAGWTVFGFGEAGFAYAMSQERVETLREARRQKVWVPADDAGALAAMEGFGITPVPLSIADVLTGLQTDLIEGVAVPPVGAVALQWYTQVDYMLELPLLYIYGVLTVDDKAFRRIDAGDRAVVREVMSRQFRTITERNRADHSAAVEAMASQGVEIVEPSDAAVAAWREGGAEARAAMVEAGVVSPDLAERVMGLLERERAAGAGVPAGEDR
jgi:TRAP-type C4-dicarboxylate transport system substrate-binding protein